MADYYSRREMSLHDERIRDDEQLYVSRERRSNADEFQTLSRSDDHGLVGRDLGTLARFQWYSLFDESRDGSTSNNGFASHGRNYDTVVERPVPIVNEGIRNVPNYDTIDTNVDGSRYIGRSQNATRLSIEDDRNYSGREREYPQRQSVDEVNGHIGRTRNVTRIQIEDDRNYSGRDREYLQRQSVDEVNGLMFRSEDSSHSLTPRSHSSGQRTLSRGSSRESLPQEGQYRAVDGIGSSSRIPPTRLSSYYRTRSADGVSPRARGEYAPNAHSSDVYVHPESHGSRDYSLTAVSDDNYDDDHRVQGYNDRGSYGIDVVNAMLPRDQYVGNSRRDAVMEEGYSGLHDISRLFQEAPALDNYHGSRIGYVYGEINAGPRNSYPDHRTEEIRLSRPHEEQFTYERHTRDMSDEQHGYLLETSPRIMDVRGFSSPEQPNTLKRKLALANETSETSGAKRSAYAARGASSYDERHLSAEDEDGLRLSNRYNHHHGESHSRAHTGVSIAEARQPSNGLHKSRQKPLNKHDECSKSDVMTRLKFPPAVSRPCAPQLSWPKEAKRSGKSPHVTNAPSSVKTYVKAKGTDFKKKLKSVPKPVACPSTATDVVVLQSGPNANKQQKHAIKDSGSMNYDDLRSQDVDADQPVLKVEPLNVLPEDSKIFKQNVDKWFFKCMVLLYKNINYQKKFKGQRIGCRLKCVICSSFKEFCETKDVAAHAFASLKVGYRAQHLGFHRALCVLMGWDSSVAANGRWVCQSLPEPVAWTLREDAIIWPPVVIIQNFQARNCQLNEIGKLSIELKNILNDKGFAKEIKAIHEKPGNPNFMVVEFIGTAHGLKEAERLHNSFAENNYGRAELAQLDAEVVFCKVADKKPEDTRKLVDKSEDDQYPVDKKEDDHIDQELLDRIKDEQSVVKSEDYRNSIDKREDENEHMKIDQQLVDKADDDQEPIGRDRDDLSSVDKADYDQEPVGKDQDDSSSVDKGRNDQVLVDEAQGEQKPVDNLLGDQELVKETQGEQKPVNNSLGDQELVKEAQGEQIPVDKSKADQEQANKTSDTRGLTDNRKDNQEPLDKTGYDQEPVGLTDNSKDDQELVEEAQGEQIHVDMSKGDQEQANKTSDTQGLTNNRKDDQWPLDKTGYDQEPVELADNRKDNKEPLGKTTYDQEPARQKGDDHEPVGKKYSTLYGYLGIIEDFHRLPNEMKHHHIARSKEEVFASYNALI